MKVLIIIPAYNEEKNLKRVIGKLQQVCPQFDYVIVNDGSTDGTSEIIQKWMIFLFAQKYHPRKDGV